MNWLLLINSLLVSSLTVLLAAMMGLVVAMALAGVEARWRNRMRILVVASLAMPPFLVTNTWLDLVGPNGPLHGLLPFKLYSPLGAIGLLALLTWPITTLLTLGAWRKIEAAQLEGEPALRGAALVRWLLWPAARPALAQAAVITFVLALNNFSVPVILQVPVFPEELWLALSARLDESGAWSAAAPLVLAPIVMLLVLRHAEIEWPRETGPATATPWRRQLGQRIYGFAAILTGLVIVLAIGAPLIQLAGRARTWLELPDLLRAAPDVIANSALYAGATATLCAAGGLVLVRSRFGPALWICFLIPGVLLGRAATLVFNRPGLDWLYATAAVVLAAFTVRYLAVGWAGAALAMRGLDRQWVEAVRLEGAAGWPLFRWAYWPQIAPQLAATWYVVYLLALWDVETLIMIYPPGGETLALRVFNLLHYGHNAQVNAHCVVLLALALAPVGLWSLRRRVGGGPNHE